MRIFADPARPAVAMMPESLSVWPTKIAAYQASNDFLPCKAMPSRGLRARRVAGRVARVALPKCPELAGDGRQRTLGLRIPTTLQALPVTLVDEEVAAATTAPTEYKPAHCANSSNRIENRQPTYQLRSHSANYRTVVRISAGRASPSRVPLCQSRPAYCHCEERPIIPSSSRDVAISMWLNTRRPTATAAARLPRYARNDKGGFAWWVE